MKEYWQRILSRDLWTLRWTDGSMVIMPLLMLLPLIALPIFWLLPLALALPIYLCLMVMAAGMFLVMMRTMKLPPSTGAEYLIGKEAKVVSGANSGSLAPYMVRLDGELWSAQSDDILQPDERVIITAVRSNYLVVKRASDT